MKLFGRRMIRGAVLALVAVVLLAPAPALAADDEAREPFDVQGLPHKKLWVPWVFAFLFAGGCLGIALKNPHRGHLD